MKPEIVATKEPFKRIKPYSIVAGEVSDSEMVSMELPDNTWYNIPQEKFLSELNPSGHVINNRPRKSIRDKGGNSLRFQDVAKIAVALQKVIATKQKIHLATNDIEFTLTEPDRTPEKEKLFIDIKQAWKNKNMEIAVSKNIGSWLETSDTALYFYRSNKKLGWKHFGFQNGDVLFPHYDYFGELIVFGRMYSSIDDNGKSVTKLDVFDKTTITTYQKRNKILATTLGQWKQVGEVVKHGFSEIPICYKRSNDVCWGDVQPLIDTYEIAMSNMAENNRYYANAILFITGNIQDLPGREENAKILQGGAGSDAKFLASPESNEAQMNELEVLLKQIFMGSFTVSISPDTVKSSGDLPGITVKLLFSPAIEKALDSAKELDGFIDKAIRLFKEGYGIEVENSAAIENLKVRGCIKVYTPQNDEEFVRMLNDSANFKTISRETAQEKNPLAVNGENERVKSEMADEAGSLDLN